MPSANSLQPLYYYDHFYQMVDFILRTHGNILTQKEQSFIEDFRTLDLQAQCLYIRMYNRTKPIFHLNDLLYDEIGTCDAVEELMGNGYLRKLNENDYHALLSIFTKPKLLELSKLHQMANIKSSWSKANIAAYFYDHLSFHDFISTLTDLHYYLPLRLDHIERFKTWWKPKFDTGLFPRTASFAVDQTYVIIDVETTGTRSPLGRVTEIGAVKVQNGQIIDEWSSLINPQAHIPPFITDITGISNDMVKHAPLFHEIADELESFMKDAVFVAHNVNFDYGFISAELKRMGRSLKMPRICTVSSMRQYYPGHGSYSLASLCKEYAIPLTTHHRALCDAQAAAQLLLLVNEKVAS